MSDTAWSRTTIDLRRDDVGRDYQLWLELPSRFDPEREYPLVLCLDAIWTWGTVVDAVRVQALSRELPWCIIAGVAHDTADLREVTNARAMDFTTTATPAPEMTGVRVPGDQLGGAEAFRRWLDDAVLPMLRERYRVSETVLVGHSFSALFGVHVLLNTPEMFERYLLASPSVWWDDEVMFRVEADHARTHDDIAATVFMSKGSLETDEYSHHKEFHDQLASRDHPNLDLHWEQFDGENHLSVVSTAVNRGLRVLFGGG